MENDPPSAFESTRSRYTDFLLPEPKRLRIYESFALECAATNFVYGFSGVDQRGTTVVIQCHLANPNLIDGIDMGLVGNEAQQPFAPPPHIAVGLVCQQS